MKTLKIGIWFLGAILIMLSGTNVVAGNGQGMSMEQSGSGVVQRDGQTHSEARRVMTAISAWSRGALINVDAFPYEEPGDMEISSLGKMIQDEKLARDVYTAMAELWELPIFVNIAESEQRHMDSIAALMTKYGLENPVVNSAAGEFADEDIRSLCAELIEKGGESAESALSVGAFIEELDIFDLKEQLESVVDNKDIEAVYENLLRGSENHLRSFARILDFYGIVYSGSGYLTLEELEAILVSPHYRGGEVGPGQNPNGA